jgi:8-oxo-dGTP pyrophosphatase MutT (NUDIX family)
MIERLSKMLKPISEGEDADAAVALLLKPADQALQVLFVKRVESSDDPWSGQMAFPGGKRDAKDQTLKQTVVRETLEETNIDLLNHCRFLGVMANFRSTQRPDMKILPFVFLLERDPSIRLNEELEGFVWISLEELIHSRSIAKFSFGEVPAYAVRGIVIWGLTYRILEKFVRLLQCSH